MPRIVRRCFCRFSDIVAVFFLYWCIDFINANCFLSNKKSQLATSNLQAPLIGVTINMYHTGQYKRTITIEDMRTSHTRAHYDNVHNWTKNAYGSMYRLHPFFFKTPWLTVIEAVRNTMTPVYVQRVRGCHTSGTMPSQFKRRPNISVIAVLIVLEDEWGHRRAPHVQL